ncbi:MAG: hypothetical protein ACE5F1_04925 [Planctomycetota bacterium]
MGSVKERYEAALATATRYFMGQADVQKAARRIAARLEELGVPYAICGGLAVAAHGHVRLTEDVGVLVSADGLRRFKEESLGRGWVERFSGSRSVKDTKHNVGIDTVVAGQLPGDGKPKPVRFPDPVDVAVDLGDARILGLDTLLELKLASGMSAPDRPRDLDDVIQLIRANRLQRDHAGRLDPSVRAKFEELWEYAQIRRDEG